jgi:hypothetical protein
MIDKREPVLSHAVDHKSVAADLDRFFSDRERTMPIVPPTFRDHLSSLFQSAVDALVREKMGAAATTRPGLENGFVRAAAQIAALRSQGAAVPQTAPPNISDKAWTCTRLAYELLQAKLTGNTALVQKLESELQFGQCDPGWAETITEYVGYFGIGGTRKEIPYIRPSATGPEALTVKSGAVVALIGDWATGTAEAVNVLRAVAQQKPDVVIHLGDIYYSGTDDECEFNFRRIVDDVLDRANTKVPVFTLAGNHDMYAGGAGFYALLGSLNAPPLRQRASFFCLRDEDRRWQFVAMDTGLHDYNPFTVKDVLTFLEKDEEDWIAARIAEFPGKTILLSHHQLFSAFAQIGPANGDGSLTPLNPHLKASFDRFAAVAPGRIAAWFWGHEHNLCLYAPYAGLEKGRCVGHGAVPVYLQDAPYNVLSRLANPPKFLAVELDADDHVFMHGFAVIRLAADGSASADYFEGNNGTTPMYREPL